MQPDANAIDGESHFSNNPTMLSKLKAELPDYLVIPGVFFELHVLKN